MRLRAAALALRVNLSRLYHKRAEPVKSRLVARAH